jgi:DNA-binding transcriptional ArsR family regulator
VTEPVIPLAQLARDLGAAYLRFAAAIDEANASAAEPKLTFTETITEARRIVELQELRGRRQRRIVNLPRMQTESGMTTGEIARAIDYAEPNVYNAMHVLMRRGIVEQLDVPGPQRWRLVARLRHDSKNP